MAATIPRFLLPRGPSPVALRPRSVLRLPLPVRHPLPNCRHASASASKPRVLEKPTKFNPPSHGKRLKQQIPRHYGPDITQAQKSEQQTKKYPNMMPPPGSFMFWFLTSRGIHMFITLGTLALLASITVFENWRRATHFREQLPAARDLLSHPIVSISQALEVWKMDVARTSAETAERRRRSVEDVQKRSTYRRAHGLEDENAQGLGGWTARSDEESLGPSLKVDRPIGGPVGAEVGSSEENSPARVTGDPKEAYVKWESTKKPVKKWLGIW